MPLYYDYTKCNVKDVEDDIINSMINITMVIDVGEFTEKNVKDIFYFRVVLIIPKISSKF